MQTSVCMCVCVSLCLYVNYANLFLGTNPTLSCTLSTLFLCFLVKLSNSMIPLIACTKRQVSQPKKLRVSHATPVKLSTNSIKGIIILLMYLTQRTYQLDKLCKLVIQVIQDHLPTLLLTEPTYIQRRSLYNCLTAKKIVIGRTVHFLIIMCKNNSIKNQPQ